MVTKSAIARNLREIEELYNSSKSPKKKFYFAKLAVLELCGWIENSQDELIMRCAGRCVTATSNLKAVSDKISGNHGFTYERHFRPLLTLILGFSKLEKAELEFDKLGSLSKFSSVLSKLKDPRNTAAHTHTAGVLPTIDAPSVVRADLEAVYKYMRELERILKKMKY